MVVERKEERVGMERSKTVFAVLIGNLGLSIPHATDYNNLTLLVKYVL